MLPFPSIDPVIFSLGPLQVRWYGMMYLLGFLASYLLVRFQTRRQSPPLLTQDQLSDLYMALILGLVVGARLGYVLFYNLTGYLRNPLEILAVWHGGMSFHGGFLGVLLAAYLFTRKQGLSLRTLGDLIIVTAPIGLGLGRLANFINGELYGRVTGVPWGMIFPNGGPWPRHPSQLYEAVLEGGVLLILLWWGRNKIKYPGAMVVRFLVLYGLFRTLAEFFREPDPQIGFILGFLTLGQILSLSMVLGGAVLAYSNRRKTSS
jgi:phosphatidylglycerol:prolipoprotein diacylglycerol transferase